VKKFFLGGIKLLLIFLGLVGLFACAQALKSPSNALITQADPAQLGTGAGLADDGTLHIVVREGEHLVLYTSHDLGNRWKPPVRINAEPEAISANGENRPKVELAKDGGLLVSWTHPLAKRFTGNIRLARSADGHTFETPFTVHRDRSEITHRFDSLWVAKSGDVVLVWIDKRDMEIAHAAGRDYRGAGIYAAVSSDHGRSFAPEFKVADHACECCRIALTEDADGSPLVLWRHVFEPNERDHALIRLGSSYAPGPLKRATFDRWAIDACPHHGPGLAVAGDGTRHSVWFNVREGEGRVFYGRLQSGEPEGQQTVGGPRAAHADVAVRGDRVTLVWNEFDGERTHLYTQASSDGGQTFETPRSLSSTSGRVDQPRLARRGDKLVVVWHTELAGVEVYWL
jgi:hypothetical protein